MQDLGPDIQHKRDNTNGNAHDVNYVVPIADHLASAATVDAPFLVGLNRAGERLGDQRAFNTGGCVRDRGGRMACSASELINKTENEVPRQCAAQVRNPVQS